MLRVQVLSMHRRLLVALAVLCLAVAIVLAPGVQAAQTSETSATISTSFSPNRLGARTTASFSVHFSGGPEGIPLPVRKSVLHLPAGLEVKFPATRGCTSAHLLAHGGHGCPANSQVGTGHALAKVELGSYPESEEANVKAFAGPLQNGQPTIEVLGQGVTPLERKVVFTLKLVPDHSPYWAKLEGTIPAIPTIPLEPNASTVEFSLRVGAGHRLGAIAVFVPKHCPAGGFPFAAEFTFEDGSTTEATSTIPCPGR